MEKVRIYYDNLHILDNEIEIYQGCEYVDIDKLNADEYANEMLDWGEWNAYAIPELINDKKIIFHI